jgi:lysophospholipase L1-like esterase
MPSHGGYETRSDRRSWWGGRRGSMKAPAGRGPALVFRTARGLTVEVSSLLVAMVVTLGCAIGQGPEPILSPGPTPPPCGRDLGAESPSILILGDSIAAADRIAVERRWSARLETLLSSESPRSSASVVNLAQGGSEVDLLEKQAEELPLDQFEIVFIISGVNDASIRPIAAWRSRYEAVVEKLRHAGLTVVIGTPPPEYLDGVYTDRYLPVVTALREIAGDAPMLDLDLYWRQAVEPGALHLDWIHPNDEAQAVIGRLAADLVLKGSCWS